MENNYFNTKIYIDVANFYHRLSDIGFNYRELDFPVFIKKLIDKKHCVGINYYVSSFLPFPKDKNKNKNYIKQQKFFNFLRTSIPNIDIKEYRMKPRNDGSGKYHEKKVDNAITTDLLLDAIDNLYDEAILLSADTDYIPPAQKITQKLNKKLTIALPNLKVARELTKISTDQIELSIEFLNKCKRI